MDDLSNEEIDEYVESGEPLDKAGAYAIQGFASKFVREIRGCYQNVVGLPVSLNISALAGLAALIGGAAPVVWAGPSQQVQPAQAQAAQAQANQQDLESPGCLLYGPLTERAASSAPVGGPHGRGFLDGAAQSDARAQPSDHAGSAGGAWATSTISGGLSGKKNVPRKGPLYTDSDAL